MLEEQLSVDELLLYLCLLWVLLIQTPMYALTSQPDLGPVVLLRYVMCCSGFLAGGDSQWNGQQSCGMVLFTMGLECPERGVCCVVACSRPGWGCPIVQS